MSVDRVGCGGVLVGFEGGGSGAADARTTEAPNTIPVSASAAFPHLFSFLFDFIICPLSLGFPLLLANVVQLVSWYSYVARPLPGHDSGFTCT